MLLICVVSMVLCLVAVTLTIDGLSEVAVESTLYISCHSVANTFAPIFFIHDRMILTNATDDSSVLISVGPSTSYLAVRDVEQEHAGVYTCAVNTGGTGGTAFAELNVTVREGEFSMTGIYAFGENKFVTHYVYISEPPAIEMFSFSGDSIQSQVETVLEGSSVLLTCDAFGIPKPTLMWEKDGEPVSSTHITGVSSEAYHRVETLTLGGVVMENSGVYTCVATNRGGDDSASAELQVIGLCLLYHSFPMHAHHIMFLCSRSVPH